MLVCGRGMSARSATVRPFKIGVVRGCRGWGCRVRGVWSARWCGRRSSVRRPVPATIQGCKGGWRRRLRRGTVAVGGSAHRCGGGCCRPFAGQCRTGHPVRRLWHRPGSPGSALGSGPRRVAVPDPVLAGRWAAERAWTGRGASGAGSPGLLPGVLCCSKFPQGPQLIEALRITRKSWSEGSFCATRDHSTMRVVIVLLRIDGAIQEHGWVLNG